jgi:hypothetical protein
MYYHCHYPVKNVFTTAILKTKIKLLPFYSCGSAILHTLEDTRRLAASVSLSWLEMAIDAFYPVDSTVNAAGHRLL